MFDFTEFSDSDTVDLSLLGLEDAWTSGAVYATDWRVLTPFKLWSAAIKYLHQKTQPIVSRSAGPNLEVAFGRIGNAADFMYRSQFPPDEIPELIEILTAYLKLGESKPTPWVRPDVGERTSIYASHSLRIEYQANYHPLYSIVDAFATEDDIIGALRSVQYNMFKARLGPDDAEILISRHPDYVTAAKFLCDEMGSWRDWFAKGRATQVEHLR